MAAPRILPVTAPVESLSPLWLTEAIIALSKLSKYANEQYTAMATVSSATHPPPSSYSMGLTSSVEMSDHRMAVFIRVVNRFTSSG